MRVGEVPETVAGQLTATEEEAALTGGGPPALADASGVSEA